ncbi:MAG: hypothetical protein KDC49_12215 [Saprospiraceae bacterium]|nr:hypothetical protein [Saprospiraceae bacterium]
MRIKLNLTIEELLAKKVKVYAEKKNISVSKLVENLLKSELESNEKPRNLTKFAGLLDGQLSEEAVAELKEKRSQKYRY